MPRRLMMLLVVIATFAGCGVTNYEQTFDSVVPATWTKVVDIGHISRVCTKSGAGCGSIERTYEMNAESSKGIADLDRQMAAHGCQPRREGNGITADCSSGVRFSVSFTKTAASLVMTKK